MITSQQLTGVEQANFDGSHSSAEVSRRAFLRATAATLLIGGKLSADTKPGNKNGIPYRALGRTGESVSLIGLGGYHLGKQSDPEESLRIIRTGLDEGVNFLDNCWDYNGGESENRMGKALRDGYRQKAFLMSKIDGRTKAAATSQIKTLDKCPREHRDFVKSRRLCRWGEKTWPRDRCWEIRFSPPISK